jgi:hypothetical protein
MSRLNQGGIGILLIVLFLIGYVVGACGKENNVACESIVIDTEKVLSTNEQSDWCAAFHSSVDIINSPAYIHGNPDMISGDICGYLN